MRKTIVTFVLLLLLFTTAAVCAQTWGAFINPEFSPEFIAEQERMIANADQTFTRLLYRETFDIAAKPTPVKPEIGYYLAQRNNKLGRKEITLAAYEPLMSNKEWGTNFFTLTGSYENFYVGMDVRMLERSDTGDDYFWIRYTNEELVGEARSAGAEIAFPIAVRRFEGGLSTRSYTNYCDLSEYANDYRLNRIEIARLNGFASVFINGKFITGFEDGLSGRFYQVFGAGLGPGQGYVTAEFDNFVLRTTW